MHAHPAPLLRIKIIHTIVWAFFAGLIFYVLWCGITGHVGVFTWVAIGFVLLEALVLMLNKWVCPLTPIARKYTDDPRDNFDIFLPNWLARHNKTIFTTLYVLGIALVLYRVL